MDEAPSEAAHEKTTDDYKRNRVNGDATYA